MNRIGLGVLALAVACSGCAREEDPGEYSQENLPRATSTILPPGGKADRPGEYLSFEEFLQFVFCEEDGRICVVDGDTPIRGGFAGLREFYDNRVQPDLSTRQQGLSVNLGNRGDDLWYGEQRFNLSFCVSDEFGDRKEEVVEATLAAVRAWEEIASVSFPYRADQDHRCHVENRQVLFPIWPAEDDAPYFARAFFPEFGEGERDIRINMAEYDAALADPELSDLTLEGIMRHELGHVLGFRHEHTRSESGAYYCFEDWNYRPGTDYDAQSVMHYPHCEGSNDWSLEFSDFDVLGAAYFYPPEGIEVLGRCDEELGPDGYVLESCEPVVRQITEWLSKYSNDVFLAWTKIPPSLWPRIQAESRVRPFDSLQDLRERVQLLDNEIRELYDYLFVDGRCPGWEFSEEKWVSPYCYPVVNQILYLANNASFDELNDQVRLDRRAVENIVAAREVRAIDTYDGLISLGYVKRVALWSMYTYLYPNWEAEQWVEEPGSFDGLDGCGSFPANALALPNCGVGPLTVEFDATPFLSGMEFSDPTWDFGDGRTGRGVQVAHTYLMPGDFQATFSAVISGVGWQSTVDLGSIDVRVLQEEMADTFSVVQSQSYSSPVVIDAQSAYLSSLEIADCPVNHEEPWINVEFDEGRRDQVNILLLSPDSGALIWLWESDGANDEPLGTMSFPSVEPAEDLFNLKGGGGSGLWLLEVENISDEEIILRSWTVDLICAQVYTDASYLVGDGLGANEPHTGPYPGLTDYVGYENDETASPGDAGYREFTVPDASTVRIKVRYNVEDSYDFLEIRDLATGELVYDGTGPASSGIYETAIVEIASNQFSIGVRSDHLVNRFWSWRLVDLEIDP